MTEGDDNRSSTRTCFAAALLILNKIDLLPYVPFDVTRFLAAVNEVNPRLQTLQVSALKGDGLGEWYTWIANQRGEADARARGEKQ